MNKMILVLVMLLGLRISVLCQVAPHPRHYVCYKASGPITLDGKLNDESWKSAPWSEAFLDIEGPSKPAPTEQTHIKMLWDDSSLYIGAHIETKNIWATLTRHDDIIFHDNDFEIFVDPDGDNYNYGELEFNAFGTLMDIFLGKPYRDSGFPIFGWECKGIKNAVSYEGTINDPSDIDTAWNIEIKIPLKSILDLQRGKKQIASGTQWRINFSRVQWDVKVENNSYQKLHKPEHNWVWSPQWAINMHHPEYWGYLQFSSHEAGTSDDPFLADKNWPVKMQLIAVYEAEKKYYNMHHQFTDDFSKLKLPGYVETDKLLLQSNGTQYVLKTTGLGKLLSIDQAGLLTKDN